MAHSFVMSFKHEIDSFLAYAGTFPQKTTLLVDTYNSRRGIENAVTVGLYLKEKNCRLQGIRLDSGDIVSLSRFARRSLAAAGLGFVKIFASGNLDEFKIQRLLERGAAVDYFGVGTNMGTSIDAPALDAIYKLSEITDESGKFSSVMKLSKAKVTYPARKQAYRISDRQGRFVRDILGLAGERIHGRPLLIKVVNKGKVIYQSPALEDVRSRLKESLDNFPASLKKMGCAYKYPVFISPGLKKVRDRLLKQLKKGQ
jgi:nicotinate phosphoribosyltransferase